MPENVAPDNLNTDTLDIIEKNEKNKRCFNNDLCDDFCYTNTFAKGCLVSLLVGFLLLVFFVIT
jgi:hypothetical protein